MPLLPPLLMLVALLRLDPKETQKQFKEIAAQLGITPQAVAETFYKLNPAQAAKMSATPVMDAATAGAAEQTTAATGARPDVVTGLTFQGDTPQATAATAYQLDAAKSASLTATAVSEAAKAGIVPQEQAQTTSAQSSVQAQQRSVAQQELVDVAKQNLQITEPVQAVAATMDKLNQEAKMVAQQGSFSQALAEAQTGTVEAASTVAGQLEKLMSQFNDGTPAWAAGAIRQANAAMAARGLGGSSMAGAAIVQAAMEAAVPIAAKDAETFATMGLQNLSNRQAVSLANAAASQKIELENLNNQPDSSASEQHQCLCSAIC
jgi:hypothetical protein